MKDLYLTTKAKKDLFKKAARVIIVDIIGA